MDEPVLVPWQQLSEAALLGVMDDFILREGTDYGGERSLVAKRAAVMDQIREGSALIVFDPRSESVTLRLNSDFTPP